MTEPRTEAGKTLLALVGAGPEGQTVPAWEPFIALIEAEAYAKGQADERERLDTALVNTADDVADVYCISIDQWDAIIEGNA